MKGAYIFLMGNFAHTPIAKDADYSTLVRKVNEALELTIRAINDNEAAINSIRRALSGSISIPNSILGTVNQIIVTDSGGNTVTLSTPQDIAITSNVTFNDLSLTGSISKPSGDLEILTISSGNINIEADGAITLGTDGVEKITLDNDSNVSGDLVASGDVGVGTASPATKLEVIGDIKGSTHLVNLTVSVGIGGNMGDTNAGEIGPGYLNLSRDDTAAARQIEFYKNGSLHSGISTDTNGFNIVDSGGTADFTVDTGGNVGIGTTAPNELLEVTGKIRTNTNFNVSGTDGIGGTFTFGGGGTGDIATMTFTGGILTGTTTVP